MPFTLYHLGPALFLGLAFSSLFSLPALILGSIVPDLEPAVAILIGAGYPYHGFFHSFLGAFFLAIAVFALMVLMEKPIQKIMAFFKLEQQATKKTILLSAVFGSFLHVLMDSILYPGLQPLFPFAAGNPFFADWGIYEAPACTILLIIGIAFYARKITKK